MSAGDAYNLHFLAIISAVFAACAKLFIFYIGYSGRRIMRKSTVKRMRPLERIVKKYGAVAAFVAAATPIPDDLIYIPLALLAIMGLQNAFISADYHCNLMH